MPHRKATLDRDVPFVASVFGVLSEGKSIASAVDLLCDAETKLGVMILGPPFRANADGMRVIRPEWVPFSVKQSLAVLRGDGDIGVFFREDPAAEDLWTENKLFPFLSELSFVLSGEDFANDFCVVSEGPVVVSYSWRAWAHTMADWANSSGILSFPPSAASGRRWEYIDFYSAAYLRAFVDSYDEWAETLRRIVELRTVRLGADLHGL